MDQSDFEPSNQSLSGSDFGRVIEGADLELGDDAIPAETIGDPEAELCALRFKEFLPKFSDGFNSCIQSIYLSPLSESGLRIFIQKYSDVVDQEDLKHHEFLLQLENIGKLGDVEILLGLEVTVTNETGSNLGGISIYPGEYEIESRSVLGLAPDVEGETNFLLSLSTQLRQLASVESGSPNEESLVRKIAQTSEHVLDVSPIQLIEAQDSGSTSSHGTDYRFCSAKVLITEDPEYEPGSIYTYTMTVADPETSSNYTISADQHGNLTLEVEDSVDNQELGDAPLCSVRTLTEPFDMDELRPFMNAIENLLVAVELDED